MAEQNPAPPVQSPAAPTQRSFFDGGDRRTHLEQLRHLSQWSRRVLLVTGPRGVGKTTMYRQLSASLEPRAKAARINGALVNTDREVLSAMVQGFGLAAPADAGPEVLRRLIVEHALAQERSDRFCVTLIDDAELLESRAMENLMALAAESPMRLVLFGEVRLVPAVDRYMDPSKVGWHEIRLTGFGVDDVRSYLLWRFREQGHEGALPFNDSQIREIARLSEGLPARIDQMANVLLARIRSAGSGSGPGVRRFPAVHRALLAVLVVALGIAYLLWLPRDTETAGEQIAEPSLPRTAVEPVEVSPDLARRAEDADQASGRRAGEGEAPDAEVPQGESAARPPPEPVMPQDSADADADTEASRAGTAPDEAAAPPAPEQPGAEAEASANAEPPADAEPQDGPAAEATAAPQAEPAASGDPETPRAASQAPAVPRETPAPQDQPETPPQTSAPQTAAASAQQPAAGGARDAAWIMQQPGEAFTLQLVSFSTAERAAEYAAGQARPEQFARFRLQRDGRILHVVIYGRFDSRAAAQAAATQLPEAVGSVQPWIRTFAQVQEGVRTALQP